jgi:hypothetical protein
VNLKNSLKISHFKLPFLIFSEKTLKIAAMFRVIKDWQHTFKKKLKISG